MPFYRTGECFAIKKDKLFEVKRAENKYIDKLLSLLISVMCYI